MMRQYDLVNMRMYSFLSFCVHCDFVKSLLFDFTIVVSIFCCRNIKVLFFELCVRGFDVYYLHSKIYFNHV